MKKRIVSTVAVSAMILFASPAFANPVIQIWACEVINGHSSAEAIEVSSAWLEAAKTIEGGEGLNVLLRFPLAAEVNDDSFSFVLVAPDAKTWGTWVDSSPGNAALAAANEAWNVVGFCSGSSMWSAVNLE